MNNIYNKNNKIIRESQSDGYKEKWLASFGAPFHSIIQQQQQLFPDNSFFFFEFSLSYPAQFALLFTLVRRNEFISIDGCSYCKTKWQIHFERNKGKTDCYHFNGSTLLLFPIEIHVIQFRTYSIQSLYRYCKLREILICIVRVKSDYFRGKERFASVHTHTHIN